MIWELARLYYDEVLIGRIGNGGVEACPSLL